MVWINLDEAGHTVTLGQDGRSASTGGTGWDSGGLDVGESFNLTFPQAGIFPYHLPVSSLDECHGDGRALNRGIRGRGGSNGLNREEQEYHRQQVGADGFKE